MSKKHEIWDARPAKKDYVSAHAYLSLLFSEADTREIVRRLRTAPTIKCQAKDLLQASQMHLLEKGNSKVEGDIRKIKKGRKLSPVLLIRGDGKRGLPLTIADGHHRICASWRCDEDEPVACCVASLPGH